MIVLTQMFNKTGHFGTGGMEVSTATPGQIKADMRGMRFAETGPDRIWSHHTGMSQDYLAR